MRITSKGQVTIPAHIRRKAGLLPHTEVEFVIEGDAVRIVPAKRGKRQSRGKTLISLLRGTATGGLSTDQIMRLTRGE